MASSVFEERVENEGFRAAFASGRPGIGAVIGIEHARLGRGFGVAICRRRGDRLSRARRQVEPGFASAAAEREHGRAQKDDGPSLTCRAVIAIHDKIPNAAAPYKDCPVLARAGQSRNCSEISGLSPIFAVFPVASARLSLAPARSSGRSRHSCLGFSPTLRPKGLLRLTPWS